MAGSSELEIKIYGPNCNSSAKEGTSLLDYLGNSDAKQGIFYSGSSFHHIIRKKKESFMRSFTL